ncbi:MAG: PQQ-binding-like beta-propeller repeat protein [Phycisphaerae bacterium]
MLPYIGLDLNETRRDRVSERGAAPLEPISVGRHGLTCLPCTDGQAASGTQKQTYWDRLLRSTGWSARRTLRSRLVGAWVLTALATAPGAVLAQLVDKADPLGPGAGRLAKVRRPSVDPPLNGRFERSFDVEITLLEPVLPATPRSDWSQVHVYADGKLFAFDSRSGESLWAAPAKMRQQPDLLLATDSRVVLSNGFRMVGLNARTGKVVWSAGQRPVKADAPAVDPELLHRFFGHASDGVRLVSVVDDGRAVCLEVETGRMLWERTLRHRPASRPTLCDDWVAYEGIGVGAKVYCVLDAGTGDLRQAIKVPDAGQLLRMHVTIGGKLLLVFSKGVHTFDVKTGRRLWRREVEGHVIDSTVQFDLDALMLSDDGIHLVKLSLEDGSALWQSEPHLASGTGSPETVLAAGQLILMSGNLIAGIDAVDGRTLWEIDDLGGVSLRHHFLTASYVVAIGAPPFNRSGTYKAYFFRRGKGTRDANDADTIPLGTFDDVRRITVRDGSIVLQQGRTLSAWTQGPGD